MIVRVAEREDVPQLASIAGDSGLSSFHAKSIEEELGKPHAIVLVAEEGTRAVGFAVLATVADESELSAIAVSPEMRRRGIARSLLNKAIAEARGRGAAAMFLEVRSSNDAAHTFYSVEGFEETGVRPGYYAGGEDAVLMRRIIR